jgi:hypothetical protein
VSGRGSRQRAGTSEPLLGSCSEEWVLATGMGADVSRPKLPCPTEHQEQCALIRWAALNAKRYPDLAWLYAVPNGARTSMSVAKRLKAEGLRKGYPDVGLDVARGGFHGLRIEMKRRKEGRLSPEQKAWIARLTDQNYRVATAKGWEEAARILEDYLNREETYAA